MIYKNYKMFIESLHSPRFLFFVGRCQLMLALRKLDKIKALKELIRCALLTFFLNFPLPGREMLRLALDFHVT